MTEVAQDREYKMYRIFNDREVRNKIIEEAIKRYGYSRESIQVKLFVGKFKSEEEHTEIKKHLGSMEDGGVKFEVVGLEKIVNGLIRAAEQRTYINDPVIMTIKVLDTAGKLATSPDEDGHQRGKTLTGCSYPL